MEAIRDAGRWLRTHWKTLLFGAGWVLLLLAVVLWLKPFQIGEVLAPDPAETYAEAADRFTAVRTAEEADPTVNALCYSRLLTHGEETDRAIILLHGFTSCPDQFLALGQEYFDLGYNVYIPRTPHHGLVDRSGDALKRLTAEEMASFANHAVDIGHGLGKEVVVAGLSGGGTMATWIGQNREDVAFAQPMAPFLGIGFLPSFLTRPLTNLVLTLPNFFLWWDPTTRDQNPLTAPYAYPRYATHGLGEVLRLGFIAQDEARHVPPAVDNIVMITNANDESVDNTINDLMTRLWQGHGASSVDEFEFGKDLGLPHDLITPTRPGNRVDLVYPILIDITEENQ